MENVKAKLEEKESYEYIGKTFDKRYLIAGLESGCKQTKRLDEFLDLVLEGDFEDQITRIYKESNFEDFKAVVALTKAKKTPVLVDLKTGKHLAGFKIPKLAKFLS